MITPKENYLLTLRGEVPEYVPRYTFGPMPGQNEPVATHMFEPPILNQHRINMGGKDIWGVNYVPTAETGNALLPEPGNFILSLDRIASWRDVLKAPDISGIDWEKMVRENVEKSGIDRTQTAMALNLHFGYFQHLMSFMGFTEGLMAFYEEPEHVKEILDYLSEFYMAVADQVIDLYKPDILTFMDDTAAWANSFISPEIYREFIMPHHEKWAKRGRDRGLLMTMHNCGKSESAVPMWVEMGIRSWDPAQTCNDLAAIKKQYKGKMTIAGGWDGRGRLLADDVSEEEIRQSVRDTIDTYAPGGGFVWCGGFLTGVDDKTGMEKNRILMDEVVKYGRDFYKR
jgi:hypothetical protein